MPLSHKCNISDGLPDTRVTTTDDPNISGPSSVSRAHAAEVGKNRREYSGKYRRHPVAGSGLYVHTVEHICLQFCLSNATSFQRVYPTSLFLYILFKSSSQPRSRLTEWGIFPCGAFCGTVLGNDTLFTSARSVYLFDNIFYDDRVRYNPRNSLFVRIYVRIVHVFSRVPRFQTLTVEFPSVFRHDQVSHPYGTTGLIICV